VANFLFESPRTSPHICFHGTSEGQAESILREGFSPSCNDGEWLGHGIYFWDSLDAAWLWADKYFSERPAVIGATVMLGHCLDLDNAREVANFLSEVHRELVAEFANHGNTLPTNAGADKYLDCLVYNRAASSTYPPVDSLVCTFRGGNPIYSGASVHESTRRMYCVRTSTLIQFPGNVP